MIYCHETSLIKTLLGMASPCTAKYVGHAQRTDKTYCVVVRTATGLQTLRLSVDMLTLAEAGILVEQDRFTICRQLNQPFA